MAAIAWITERRGGLRDPAVVPPALALRVTNDPASDIATQRRFVLTGLSDPDPPAWAVFILGNHTTTMQRIAMAKAAEAR